MQRRRLGRTGHESSVAILGGAAFWMASTDEGREGSHLALDRGVNHLDIAPQYGDAQTARSVRRYRRARSPVRRREDTSLQP